MNASSGFLSLLQVPPSLPLFLGFYDLLLSANDVEQEEEEEARVALTKTQSLKHAWSNNRTSLVPLFPFPPFLSVFFSCARMRGCPSSSLCHIFVVSFPVDLNETAMPTSLHFMLSFSVGLHSLVLLYIHSCIYFYTDTQTHVCVLCACAYVCA